MAETFFTSDHHFFHKMLLKNREEFSDIDDMNEQMIARWNSMIGKKDSVYYLGDFSFGKKEDTLGILKRLNGKIYYILGNHDKIIKKNSEIQKRFEWVKDYYHLKMNKQRIILSHYCFHVWDAHHYGSWHLYGHSHGNIQDDSNRKRMDVGVDTNDFYPYTFSEVETIMNSRKFVTFDQNLEQK